VTAGAIEAAITPRTRAVSAVHFVGIPCEMEGILEVARRNNLKVVEDCALALGARVDSKHVGLFGDVGCFSFYPAKHITTGEGGMLVTRHRDVAEGVRRLRAFGVERPKATPAGGMQTLGLYDVPVLGLNYRMSELQAALGRSQLRRIGENLAIRKRNFQKLRQCLEGIPSLRILDADSEALQNSHYCLVLVLEGDLAGKRADCLARLNHRGVGTSVYYPHPVPRLEFYRRKYGWDPSRYENALEISDGAFALPVGPHVGPGDVLRLAEAVRDVLEHV
jgi:dTDP-4-amino-4,6-dideoxygalactose transaminase